MRNAPTDTAAIQFHFCRKYNESKMKKKILILSLIFDYITSQ